MTAPLSGIVPVSPTAPALENVAPASTSPAVASPVHPAAQVQPLVSNAQAAHAWKDAHKGWLRLKELPQFWA